MTAPGHAPTHVGQYWYQYRFAQAKFAIPRTPSLQLRQCVYGGWSKAVPWSGATWRTRCFQLWAVDPVTLLPTTQIGNIVAGTRTVQAVPNTFPVDSVTLTQVDPTGEYLEGGIHAGLLAPNALVLLRTSVTTPCGTLISDCNLYRVNRPLSRGEQEGLPTDHNVSMDQYLTEILDQPFGYSVPVESGIYFHTPIRAMIYAKEWMQDNFPGVAPIIGTRNTYLTVLADMLWWIAGKRIKILIEFEPAAGWQEHPMLHPPPPPNPIPTTYQDPPNVDTNFIEPQSFEPGREWPTWRTVLAEFQSGPVSVRLAYDDDGTPIILLGNTRRFTSLLISCNVDTKGLMPVPWEGDVNRTPSRPEYTLINGWAVYQQTRTTTGVLAQGSIFGSRPQAAIPAQTQTWTQVDFLGTAISNSKLNPHIPPYGRGKGLINPIPYEVQTLLEQMLQDTLGKADPLSVNVDNAFPLPVCYDEIRVDLPKERANGYWAFVGAQVPLGIAPATWSLQWRQDC